MRADLATPTKANNEKAKTIAVWIVTGLLTFIFVLSGFMKFVNPPEMAEHFAKWGYPDWFRVLIGLIEIGAALALLTPRNAFYGAAALGVVMVGAMYTHLAHDEVPEAVAPLVLLILLALVAYARLPLGIRARSVSGPFRT
jgi:putative oxidoreductase